MSTHGLHRQRKASRCIFCLTNKPDSKEHAWPNWTLKRLLPEGEDIQGTFGHDHLNALSPGQKQIKVLCVCEACNTGWMKDLEDAVLPMAEGMMNDVKTTLNRSQQSLLAAWAMKTAMVWDFLTDRELPVFYSDEQRSRLRASGTLPTHSLIWLARNGGVSTGMRGLFTDVHSIWVKSKPVAPVQNCVTTFGYKHLLLQIVTCGIPDPNGIAMLPAKAGPWDVGTVRVWPPQTAADWPPLMSFDALWFTQFVDRYKDGRIATPADIGPGWFPPRSKR